MGILTSMQAEDIAQLYVESLDDKRRLYKLMREIANEGRAARTEPVRTVAVQTTTLGWVTGWTSGHFHAVKDMAYLLKSLGYNVVMVLDGVPPESEYPYGIDVEVLPVYGNNKTMLMKRFVAIREMCDKRNVDAVVFNAYGTWRKYIDYLMFKLAVNGSELSCYLQFHSSFARMQSEIGLNYLVDMAPTMGIYDALITESEVGRSFWSNFNPRVYFRPLPLSCDVSGIKSAEAMSHDVLYLARLDEVKNQEDAIVAFSEVLKRVPDARLVLAGDESKGYGDVCRALVAELGIGDSVLFTGYVRGEDKEALLAGAACAISTSRLEGYPLALAECKAHGLPLIMYDIPDATVCEGGRESGTICVEQYDVSALADAIASLLQNDAERMLLSQRAHDHMERIHSFDEKTFWEELFRPEADMQEEMLSKEHAAGIIETFFNTYRHYLRLLEQTESSDATEMNSFLCNLAQKSDAAIGKLTSEQGSTSSLQGRVVVRVPAFGTKDTKIVFDSPFDEKPAVICTLYSTSSSPEFAQVNCSAIKASRKSFTLRLFNGSELPRTPAVSWVAVPSGRQQAGANASGPEWVSAVENCERAASGQVEYSVDPNGIADFHVELDGSLLSCRNVLCSLVPDQLECPEVGMLKCAASAVSHKGFSLRVFNNSAVHMTGKVRWLALPFEGQAGIDFKSRVIDKQGFEEGLGNVLRSVYDLERLAGVAKMVSGRTAPVKVPARGYTDVRVAFTAAPAGEAAAAASLYSSSTDPQIGMMSCCVLEASQEGLLIRVFNNGDKARTPAISWACYFG